MARREEGIKTSPIPNFVWETTTPPSRLWHYTNADGILGIIRNGSLWCTEYRYLNDKNEIAAFAVHLIARLREELAAIYGTQESAALAQLVSGLYNTWNVFICSFCIDADRNEHWSQYAGKAGYALGFDTQKLLKLAVAQGFTLGPTFYGEESALNIATAVLKDNLHKLESMPKPLSVDHQREIVSFFCRLALSYAPFFKAGSFEREREWRLVRATGIDADGKMQFRAKSPFGLVAYHPFNLHPATRNPAPRKRSKPSLLIPEAMIGPGNETAELARSMHLYMMCSQNGFETLAKETSSSLRL